MGIVAAAQIASIYYDARATTQRVAESIAEAARSGAWLVAFTESCIPGYPDWVWRVPSRSSSPSAEPFATFEQRFVEQAIAVPGPETNIIAAACRAAMAFSRLFSLALFSQLIPPKISSSKTVTPPMILGWRNHG